MGRPVLAASARENVLFPDPASPVTTTRRPSTGEPAPTAGSIAQVPGDRGEDFRWVPRSRATIGTHDRTEGGGRAGARQGADGVRRDDRGVRRGAPPDAGDVPGPLRPAAVAHPPRSGRDLR